MLYSKRLFQFLPQISIQLVRRSGTECATASSGETLTEVQVTGDCHHGKMAAFRCNRRYSRTLCVSVLFVSVVLLYVATHTLYPTVTNSLTSGMPSFSSDLMIKNVRATIKKIVPSSDGNLDMVISINMKDIVSYLDWFSGGGEATRNALPANVSVAMHKADICSSRPSLRWLFYVHSAPSNGPKRDNIRATWGNPGLHPVGTTLLVFIVGQADDPGTQRQLEEEQRRYGDIVQGDFVDAYKNLTLKAIFSLKWIVNHCKNAEFMLKADDDAFVNIFEWMRVAQTTVTSDYRRFIMCPLWKADSMPILRDPAKCMKWCVKYTEFPGRSYFPQYCAGLAVLMTRDIVVEMYRTAVKTPFFWIDDVFLTGIVSAKLKAVHYVDMMSYFSLKEAEVSANYFDETAPLKVHIAHVKNLPTFKKMWQALLSRRTLAGHTDGQPARTSTERSKR